MENSKVEEYWQEFKSEKNGSVAKFSKKSILV